AVWPDQACDRALLHLEAGAVDRMNAPKVSAHLRDFQCDVHLFSVPCDPSDVVPLSGSAHCCNPPTTSAAAFVPERASDRLAPNRCARSGMRPAGLTTMKTMNAAPMTTI